MSETSPLKPEFDKFTSIVIAAVTTGDLKCDLAQAAPAKSSRPGAIAPKTQEKSGSDFHREAREKYINDDTKGAIAGFNSAIEAHYYQSYASLARAYHGQGNKLLCVWSAKCYLSKYPDSGQRLEILAILSRCDG